MNNKPPPLDRDYKRNPNIKALKRKGFITQGSTLGLKVSDSYNSDASSLGNTIYSKDITN